ncbi:MAG: sensor histidine kinase [Bacillota bacterium]|nr:sensor histidine kinase [Bacillota bacterium]
MRYVFKFTFLACLVALFAVNGGVSYDKITVLVLIMGINVFMERFSYNIFIIFLSFILICIGIWMDKSFTILLGVAVYDFTYKKTYLGLIPVITGVIYLLKNSESPAILLILGICAILAFVERKKDDRELTFKNSIDDERRLRYELEDTKSKLLNSSREVAYLAETRERNRIAREIHDNIGHSIAGILIQLQAAYKLYGKNDDKSKEILKKSIDGLADSVTMLRDTVHNIKPKDILGVEYIKTIISDFLFCPVDFKFTGDFDKMPPEHMEIIATNIKEALTNASRHSKATQIVISIDINETFMRLLIKDNGRGCSTVKEGMGLGGMRERVANAGGTMSVTSDDGFMIVCVLPGFNRERSGIF